MKAIMLGGENVVPVEGLQIAALLPSPNTCCRQSNALCFRSMSWRLIMICCYGGQTLCNTTPFCMQRLGGSIYHATLPDSSCSPILCCCVQLHKVHGGSESYSLDSRYLRPARTGGAFGRGKAGGGLMLKASSSLLTSTGSTISLLCLCFLRCCKKRQSAPAARTPARP